MARLRIGSVYTGILGLDLGVEDASGGETVWTCENAAFPRAVIAKHRPHLPCFESDEAIPADAPTIDVLIGGPPCQPTSTAGKRKGADDERWRWPAFLRLARDLRPSIVFVENPSALLTLDGGRAFGGILGALASLGFDARWTCLRASDVGAPHRRERLFVYAWRVADADRESDGATRSGGRHGERGARRCGEDVAHADDESAVEREERERPRRVASGAGRRGERGGAASLVADARRDGGERRRGSADVACSEGASRDEGGARDARRNPARDRGAAVAHGDGNGHGVGGASHDLDGTLAHGDDAHRRGARSVGDTARTRREGTERPLARTPGRIGSHDAGRRGPSQSRLGRDVDGLPRRLDPHRWPAPPGCEQYEHEPPRTVPADAITPHRRPRLKALGNAVVKQQAAAAWRLLASEAAS